MNVPIERSPPVLNVKVGYDKVIHALNMCLSSGHRLLAYKDRTLLKKIGCISQSFLQHLYLDGFFAMFLAHMLLEALSGYEISK